MTSNNTDILSGTDSAPLNKNEPNIIKETEQITKIIKTMIADNKRICPICKNLKIISYHKKYCNDCIALTNKNNKNKKNEKARIIRAEKNKAVVNSHETAEETKEKAEKAKEIEKPIINRKCLLCMKDISYPKKLCAECKEQTIEKRIMTKRQNANEYYKKLQAKESTEN